MITKRIMPMVAGAACLAVLALSQTASADVLISVDKSAQRMTVTVDGQLRYNWPVSTGKPGYDTPSGTFRAFRMVKDHRSREYDDAPMPYSIFFTTTGVAVHGTNETRRLGRAASHGCVRLSVQHAAILWDLVKRESMSATTVQVRGAGSGSRVATAPTPRLAPMNEIASAQDPRADRRPLFPFLPFLR